MSRGSDRTGPLLGKRDVKRLILVSESPVHLKAQLGGIRILDLSRALTETTSVTHCEGERCRVLLDFREERFDR